jgi:hypothetical protein
LEAIEAERRAKDDLIE